MENGLVSVVVLTMNRKVDVIKCIESLKKSNYDNIVLIVVDNGSTDGTPTEIAARFKDVNLYVNETNLGINEGRNVGQKHTMGDFVLFLDCDTIVDENMISELVALMNTDDTIGLAVPKMYYYEKPDLLWYAGAKLNLITSQTTNIGAGEIDQGQYDSVTPVSHGPTAFMASRKVLDVIGGHDKKYFMCYADTDFAYRARAAGFKTLYCPKAKLWHKIKLNRVKNSMSYYGFDSLQRTFHYARNRFLFMKTHAPLLKLVIFLTVFSSIYLVFFSYQIIRCGGGLPFLKAYWSGFFNGWQYILTNKFDNSNYSTIPE